VAYTFKFEYDEQNKTSSKFELICLNIGCFPLNMF